uniref:GLOBIN domain-containing protein n=1 Tax=Panagrellus redivivus TaxID=6233 RepID=A0A7E4VX32_PANRE
MIKTDHVELPTYLMSSEESDYDDAAPASVPINRSDLIEGPPESPNPIESDTASNISAMEDALGMDYIPLARGHWLFLGNNSAQGSLCRHMLLYVLQTYPQTRPMWQFSRDVDFGLDGWKEIVMEDNRFRHHAAAVQSGVSMVVDHLDDIHAMAKVLRELGAHHFFYDAWEPHFELMHEGFMDALVHLTSTLEEDLEKGWNQLWSHLKVNIGMGVAHQRQLYLTEAVTLHEMNSVRSTWDRIKDSGLEAAGQILVKEALKTYEHLLRKHMVNFPVNLPESSLAFKMFAEQVISALDTAIAIYTPSRGFYSLPSALKDFVTSCLMMEVCPTLIRKSFLAGLMHLLKTILGEDGLTEVATHTWSKIYRILEQAIIANIIRY